LQNASRRPGDVVARFGGEEFVVLLSMVDTKRAVSIAEKICKEVESLKLPHQGSRVSKYLTLSIGIIVAIPNPSISVTDFIKYADEALYIAKTGGRNRVELKEQDSK